MTTFLYLYFPTIYVHDIIISINDSFTSVKWYQHVENVYKSSSKMSTSIYIKTFDCLYM